MTKLACVVCTASTDAMLCAQCARKLEKIIAELPALLHELDVTIARQDRGTGRALYAMRGSRLQQPGIHYDEGTTALPSTPWPFSWDAADLRWRVESTVQTWARHILEARGLTAKIDQPGGFLLASINSIRHDEAAGQIYDELLSCRTDLMTAIDRQPADQFAGRCDATQITFVLDHDDRLVPQATICGVDLYGHEDQAEVHCPACGMKYQLEERLAEMRDRQINEQLARAHTIANALSTIDAPLSPERLRKWIQRDAVFGPAPHGPACLDCGHATCRHIRRLPIIVRDFDDDGHSLYRVGDVRARMRAIEEAHGLRLAGGKMTA